MLKTYEERGLKSVNELISMLEETLNYLEKANSSNLGDFTDAGKIVNAGYNNYTLYWKWYNELKYGNYQAQAYCAGYVSIMLCVAFGHLTAEKLLHGKTYINCQVGYNTFKAAGKIVSKPRIGDVIFFWNNSLNRYGHTGFVVGIDETGYTTIEANTSAGNDVVVRNGGATCRKHYTYSGRTVAFGRIDYEKYGIALYTESFSIKKEWLTKNNLERMQLGKPYCALAFQFAPNTPNYYVIDEKLFKKLLEYMEGDCL